MATHYSCLSLKRRLISKFQKFVICSNGIWKVYIRTSFGRAVGRLVKERGGGGRLYCRVDKKAGGGGGRPSRPIETISIFPKRGAIHPQTPRKQK